MKAKRSYLAECDGQLYVLLKTVMNPWLALMDGVSVTMFKKSRQMWIKASDAINWLQGEYEATKNAKYQTMAQNIQRHLSNFVPTNP